MSKAVRLLLSALPDQTFPYSLLYRSDSEEVVILAVMHQKRHPSYWLSRSG